MNCDLEGDLEGRAEMRALVEMLRAAPQARVDDGFTRRVMAAAGAGRARAERRAPRPRLPPGWLLKTAAGLAACFLFTHLLLHRGAPSRPSAARGGAFEPSTAMLVGCQRADGTFSSSSAAQYMQAFAVTALAEDASAHASALDAAVGAITRSQNADGGWANAELSARNVEALRAAAGAGASGAARAYRRGRRYLRVNGIGEITRADLAVAARDAGRRLDGSDRGLACSAALCAAM